MAELKPVASAQQLMEAASIYNKTEVSEEIMAYIISIAEASRKHHEVYLGVSPRGTLSLLKAIQVRALLNGRTFVTPDDVKAMAVPVLSHRIVSKGISHENLDVGKKIILDILSHTEVPKE